MEHLHHRYRYLYSSCRLLRLGSGHSRTAIKWRYHLVSLVAVPRERKLTVSQGLSRVQTTLEFTCSVKLPLYQVSLCYAFVLGSRSKPHRANFGALWHRCYVEHITQFINPIRQIQRLPRHRSLRLLPRALSQRPLQASKHHLLQLRLRQSTAFWRFRRRKLQEQGPLVIKNTFGRGREGEHVVCSDGRGE